MNYFWHNPGLAVMQGDSWHVYNDGNGRSVCRMFQLVGVGMPKDARGRMPSRAHASICTKCERDRPAQLHFLRKVSRTDRTNR